MNSYNENDRMDTHHDFDYKPKLLGILPQNYVYKRPERFETSELLLCKRPSEQQWMRGPLFTSDHPSLIGQAIIEKKLQSSDSQQTCNPSSSTNTIRPSSTYYNHSDNEEDANAEQEAKIAHLESQLSCLWSTDSNHRLTTTTKSPFVNNYHNHHQHNHHNQQPQNNDDAYFTYGSSEGSFNSVQYHTGGGDNNDDNVSTDSSEDEVKNFFNTGSPAMKFLKNNFQPNSDVLPDFTCNRNVLVNLMTEPNDFVIQATKQKFLSRLDNSGKEFSTIELHFRPIRMKSDFEDINSSAIRIVTAIQSKTEIPYEIVNGKVVQEIVRPTILVPPPQVPSSSSSDSDGNWRRQSSKYATDFPRLNHHHNESESCITMDKTNLNSPKSTNELKSYSSITPSIGMVPRCTPYKSRDRVDRESVPGINKNLETASSCCEVDSDIESELTETPYYAFLQGKLTKVDTHRPELSQSFTVNFGMYVDGVWVNKTNPYNFTCADLAEVKTAKSNTLKGYGVGRDFYKQVRMAQNWSQTYLSGIKQYMVGVTGPSLTDPNERSIEELLLYSVDKVPDVVKLAGEQNGFKPWTPKELQSKLFSYLKDINQGMSSKPHGTPINFFHYHGTSFLTVMTNAEVHDSIRCLQENRKKVILKGLQTPPPMAIEDRQNAFDDAQILTLLNFIKWPIKFGKPIVKRFSREIQLTFETELLAIVFSRLVKSVWRFKNSLSIPPGLERLWIETRPPITKRQENAILVNKRISSGYSHYDTTGDKFVNNITNSIPIIDNRFTNQQKPRKLGNTIGLYPRSMWNTNN